MSETYERTLKLKPTKVIDSNEKKKKVFLVFITFQLDMIFSSLDAVNS